MARLQNSRLMAHGMRSYAASRLLGGALAMRSYQLPPIQHRVTLAGVLKYCSAANDVITMPPAEGKDERRRTPRFSCGGEARIYSLPSNGVHVPGRLRNLSLGGACLDTSHAFDMGARTEILVSVNAASFRTLGLVRAADAPVLAWNSCR